MRARHLSWALLPLLSTTALAAPRHELTAGVSTLNYMGTFRPSPGVILVEAAGLRTMAEEGPWSALQLGGGVRLGLSQIPPQLPLEAFVRMQLSAKLGIWRPAGGIELGLSGFNQRFNSPAFPYNRLEGFEDATLGPAYGAFTLSPLRFQVSRFHLSALQVSTGTSLGALGSNVRVQVGLLSLGGWL